MKVNKLSKKEMLNHLDDFLVNSSELDSLTDRLNKFNIFNVLKIKDMEIRHSNTLGWLLDPSESHKLGDKFLRRFLSGAVLHAISSDVNLRASTIELMDFHNIEVQREYRNIDVLVIDYTNSIVTVIENKINSKEIKGQLDKYNSIVDEEYPNFQKIKVYLTINGDDPSEHGQQIGYSPFSHLEVLKILEPMIEVNKTTIPEEPYMFINHYLDTLRILTMEDKEVIDLCRKIYKKHRVAIDMINQFATSTNFNDEAFDVVKDVVGGNCMSKAWARVYFLTPTLDKILPDYGGESYSAYLRKTPLVLWFLYQKDKGRWLLAIEVGDFPDSSKRKSFLDHLDSLGFDIKKQSYRDEARYSRVKTFTTKMDELISIEDSSAVRSSFDKLYTKALPEIKKIENSLKDYEW